MMTIKKIRHFIVGSIGIFIVGFTVACASAFAGYLIPIEPSEGMGFWALAVFGFMELAMLLTAAFILCASGFLAMGIGAYIEASLRKLIPKRPTPDSEVK